MFGRDTEGDDFETARRRLLDSLVESGHLKNQATIEALKAVPRHEFVPESRRNEAYSDRPLPIGAGQTISAPHMVAIMCDLLVPEPGDKILEIGTGCGYHAAVTAEIVGVENVYTVEYVESLATDTRRRLDRLGYGGINLRVGDGRGGWPEHAPYDGAYLTCAAPELPDEPIAQLRLGGRLLAPIGTTHQTLVEAIRTEAGIDRRTHGGVRFVTMQGEDR